MILYFDTETDSLYQRDLPHDHPMQPNLIQLGCLLVEGTRERATLELIVRPDGFIIPKTATEIHGISTEDAARCGVGLGVAVAMFANLCRLAQNVCAHHLSFDERVMATAFHRAGRHGPELPVNRICTVEASAPILKIPPTAKMKAWGHGDKPKNPSLAECYDLMFGEELKNAHSALADARACARVHAHILAGRGRLNPMIRFFKRTWR